MAIQETQSECMLTQELVRACFNFGPNYVMDVHIGETEYGHPGLNIRLKNHKGKTVMEVDDFHGDYLGLWINKKEDYIQGVEIKVEDEFKRNGIGKAYVLGRVKLAQALGISRIKNTAGRSDGVYFWSRHGYRLKNKYVLDNFQDRIRTNLRLDCYDLFSDDLKERIERILDNEGVYANQEIARLNLSQDQINALFYMAEAKMVLDLTCQRSMAILIKALNRGSFIAQLKII